MLKPEIADLLVADFNLGHSPNNICGNYGPFNGTGACSFNHTEDSSGDPNGHSIRIVYQHNSNEPNPYCGFWMNMSPEYRPTINAADYNFLKFKVKGTAPGGFVS